jgi:hypothetical protein
VKGADEPDGPAGHRRAEGAVDDGLHHIRLDGQRRDVALGELPADRRGEQLTPALDLAGQFGRRRAAAERKHDERLDGTRLQPAPRVGEAAGGERAPGNEVVRRTARADAGRRGVASDAQRIHGVGSHQLDRPGVELAWPQPPGIDRPGAARRHLADATRSAKFLARAVVVFVAPLLIAVPRVSGRPWTRLTVA